MVFEWLRVGGGDFRGVRTSWQEVGAHSRAFVAGSVFPSRLPVWHGGQNAVRATGWLFRIGLRFWIFANFVGGKVAELLDSWQEPSRAFARRLPQPAIAARGAECCPRDWLVLARFLRVWHSENTMGEGSCC